MIVLKIKSLTVHKLFYYLVYTQLSGTEKRSEKFNIWSDKLHEKLYFSNVWPINPCPAELFVSIFLSLESEIADAISSSKWWKI